MDTTLQDLRRKTGTLLRFDRQRFRRRLSGAEKISDPKRQRQVVAVLAAEIDAAEQRAVRRRGSAPAKITYPEDLPITARRDELLAAIADHQVVIVAGETGSGKSTQLPKLCLELGRGVEGLIGHTQPRRIAARSIASRVADELGTSIGELVGYTVRFSDQVGEDTLIKVMTDGILLAEIHRDRRLSRYDTIILDEAHERSLNIDFLLGYLKMLLPQRSDLKLIVTSATIDTERFSRHFDDAPVIEVSGRTYPVEMRYRPLDDPELPEPRDQPQGICDAVVELWAEGEGDILVFCSGEREIRDAADALESLDLRHTEVVQLYARLPAAQQQRVFQPHTGRRIVLATNVAETSLTVPGIRYVVDPGTARISRFSRRTKVQRLPIEAISQASADQRAGRCGRLGPGICVRLYPEDDYLARPEFTEPEILRTNLASVLLQMAALDLGEMATFPFLDPPDARTIRDGINLLHELGAVDPQHQGTRRWLTPTGRQLAKFPLDPRLGRMVIEAAASGCLREVLVIAAALAIQDPRERPEGLEAQADQMHARYRDDASDLVTWLNLWRYLHEERRSRSSSQFRRMCRKEYLNYRRVREWQDIHAQLRDVAKELGFVVNRKATHPAVVHRTLLTGLLSHVGKKDPDGYQYRGARGARFFIAPGSTLFKRAPEWVMAADLVETSRLWARGVASVPPEWIEEAGAHLVHRSHGDAWWDQERGAAVAHETVTIYGLPLVTDRTVLYGRIDPEGARELFIRHALVAGEWEAHHAFAAHNRAVIDEVLELEARERRTDLLVDDDTVVDLFAGRIPADITSVRHFDRWWRDAKEKTPHLLDLSIADLIRPEADTPDEADFPAVWHHGDLAMPVEYEFDPTSPTDGVTVEIPVVILGRVDPSVFEWNVPGIREELVVAVIRSLPKQIRRDFVPIPDTAREIVVSLDPAAGRSMAEVLRRELTRRSGKAFPPEVIDLDALPAHLRPTFRVVDEEGIVVAQGKDLAGLKAELAAQTRSTLAASGHDIERSGLTAWSIGELPRVIEIEGEGSRALAYPALVDEGDSVAVRLMATAEEQADAMWRGTIRLLLINLPSPTKLLRPMIDGDAKLAIRASPYRSTAEWIDDCLACAVGGIMAEFGGPVWDAPDFDALLAFTRDALGERAAAIGQESLAVLATAQAVSAKASGSGLDAFEESVADVSEQLAMLIYPGFLAGVGEGRVADVHRYVRAMERRLDHLPGNPGRDLEMMDRAHRLENEYERLADLLPSSPELIDVAWMLQELRVSLFAQTIGTRGKVSEKRVERALAGLLS
jgi:ATP-dependent helicase HrpA